VAQPAGGRRRLAANSFGVNGEREWEILSSEYVLESPWYTVRRDVCRLPDGTIVDPYYVREHAGFAIVFAITADRMVVFNRQYKHGIGERVLELPAGSLEPGETPETCARRELEEETGYTAPAFERAASFILDPTSSTGRIHVFVARDATPGGVPAREITEAIDLELVGLDRVIDAVRGGHVSVQSHVAAIYAVLDRLGMIEMRAPRSI